MHGQYGVGPTRYQYQYYDYRVEGSFCGGHVEMHYINHIRLLCQIVPGTYQSQITNRSFARYCTVGLQEQCTVGVLTCGFSCNNKHLSLFINYFLLGLVKSVVSTTTPCIVK